MNDNGNDGEPGKVASRRTCLGWAVGVTILIAIADSLHFCYRPESKRLGATGDLRHASRLPGRKPQHGSIIGRMMGRGIE